ncbi:hypothetical protein PAMA_006454 [Pampus argenteus]
MTQYTEESLNSTFSPHNGCSRLAAAHSLNGSIAPTSPRSSPGVPGDHVTSSLSGAADNADEKKNNVPEDFDIDMDNPETEKAAVAIQSQFRKFQKKKQDVKS